MSGGAVLVAVVLIVLNGFFVAVEFAFTASRRGQLDEMASSGSRPARWALASMNEIPITFAGAQLGVAAASLGLGFVIENSLETAFEDFFEGLGIPSGAVAGLSLVTALLIVSFLHNVLGEMAPKNATIAAPERVALVVAAPFRAYVTLLRPIIVALSWTAGAILRIFGVSTRSSVEAEHSADDIATLVKTIGAGGVIDPRSSSLLTAALRFQSTVVSEVMVPRPDLVAMSEARPAVELESMMVATGHSRIPVFGAGIDDIRGFVHAKDLIAISEADLSEPVDRALIRHLPTVPETTPVSPVLEMMRSEGVHMAVAIDEHGDVAGLVTLEDIAEELVGDIRDEHDVRGIREIRPAGRDRYLIAGQARLTRLEEIGLKLPDGDYDTVGGHLMTVLGRVPQVGDTTTTEGYTMRVRRMEGRRVREIELTVAPSDSRPEDTDS